MKRLSTQAVLLCLLAGAPALDARETWREVRSPHFVVISNASEGRAVDVAARMEKFRSALIRLLPSASLLSGVEAQIYAFRDFESFESFLPRTEDGVTPAAGYFRESPYRNVIALDLSADRFAYERIVFHEYVHLVLSLGEVDYPLWFEEGMAEFYASARLHGTSAELGVAEERHRRVLIEHAHVPMSEVLTAGEEWLLSAPPHASALFYAQSWRLVHYLVAAQGKEGHRRLAGYLGRVARGDDRLEAFRDVFDASPEAMAATLTEYVETGIFPHYQVELSDVDWEREVEARTLAMPEVQLRWGELFLFINRLREARMCLEEACRLRPDLGAAWEARGIAAWTEERHGEALAHFRRAASLEDASPTGLYLYARALLRDHSGHWIGSIPEEITAEAERALTRSLEMRPAQSETLRLLAFVYLVKGGRLDEAARLVESALTLSPGRPSLLYLYGQILARRGDYDRARSALDQIRDDAADPSLLRAADELRTRLDATQRAP